VTASCLAVAAGFISAARSTTWSSELEWTFRLLFIMGILPGVLARALQLRQHVNRCINAFVAGAALSGLAALVANFGIPLSGIQGEMSGRLVGLNVHPNGQGGTLAVAFVYCAGRLGSERRFVWLIPLLSCLIGIIMSGSISATVVTAVGTSFVIWRLKRRVRTLLSIAALSLIGTVVAISLQGDRAAFLTPVQRFSSATGQTGISTLSLRLETIRFAWQHVRKSPFLGVGLSQDHAGTFNGVTATHNMGLLAWYQGGVILFLAVNILLVAALIASSRAKSEFGVVLSGGAMTAILFAQTGPSFVDRYVWIPVILVIVYARQFGGDGMVGDARRSGPRASTVLKTPPYQKANAGKSMARRMPAQPSVRS
jgi:O-antigen ligase